MSARSLAGVLEAVNAAPSSAGDLGTELFGVVDVLDANPALRRVLTDPSTEDAAKGGLVERLFGPSVEAGTVDVVKDAVGRRWNAGRDLCDALETAGAAAVVAHADGEGRLDTVESELFGLGRTVAGDAELRGVIADRSVPADAKATLLARIFEGKVATETLQLAQQAVKARAGSFEKVVDAFGQVAADRRDRLVAFVRVAYEPTSDERERLASALAAKYGRDVHLNIVVDPSVVGGIAVSVGSEVVDATMSSRLETARRRLAG